jgi:hypothetical protein
MRENTQINAAVAVSLEAAAAAAAIQSNGAN